ncbi:MAG: right-handed parallel beta-helix repeat-containing protein [Candidatus Thermoplasmatota archaeon]
MVHRRGFYSILCLLFFLISIVVSNNVIMVSSAGIIYVDIKGGRDYTSIKSAISNASAGSTIYVYSGTYNENLIIDKELSLICVEGEVAVINGVSSTHVVRITADNVSISGFVIQNAKGTGMKCLLLDGVNHCNIKSCIIQGSKESDGIQLFSSNYNTIQGNTIRNNNQYGLNIYVSSFNSIKGNSIRDNMAGIDIYFSIGNIISDENIITRNNLCGIRMRIGANDNTIAGNTITANSKGIECSNSGGNVLYHNNFDNSGSNAIDSGNNTWDNGYPSGGNYWSDYTGVDANGDGIGDTPYIIPGGSNVDRYPLFIGNKKPLVTSANANPAEAQYGDSIRFTGGGLDTDGYITRYRWVSNINGVLYNGSESSFTRSDLSSGIHTISFTVRDNEGAWSDPYILTVTIASPVNQKPVAHITSINPAYSYYGTPVYMNGYGTDDGSITGYRWFSDIDGVLSDSQYFSTSNLSVGTHNVSFYVRDDKMEWSEPDRKTIIVAYKPSPYNKPPVPVINISDTGLVNASIVLDASSSYDPDGSIVDYTWEINGVKLKGRFTHYVFVSPGIYNVYLNVTDNNGSRSTASKTIRITLTNDSSGSNGSTGDKPENVFHFILDESVIFIVAPAIVITIFLIIIFMFLRWFKKS